MSHDDVMAKCIQCGGKLFKILLQIDREGYFSRPLALKCDNCGYAVEQVKDGWFSSASKADAPPA